jgi:hypothetical protein
MDTNGAAPLNPPYSIPGVATAFAAPNPSAAPARGLFTALQLSTAPGAAPPHPPAPKAGKRQTGTASIGAALNLLVCCVLEMNLMLLCHVMNLIFLRSHVMNSSLIYMCLFYLLFAK